MENNILVATVRFDGRIAEEMIKLIPGTYIDKSELVRKAVRFYLHSVHGVKW